MGMTESESIKDIKENILPCVGGKSLVVAINALEKQMPKKVKIQQWIYTKCDCGYEFSKHHGDGYYSIPLEKKTNYCPNCGQKLDWS